MAKIKLNQSTTIEEAFEDFITSRKTKGVVDKTIESYQNHFRAVARHLDISKSIYTLERDDLDKMVAAMRDAHLATNSINTYTRVFKVFLSWCNVEGLTNLNMTVYRGEETVKETYTDAELAVLLKKPNLRKCGFPEYRDWVIINFLLNSGSRAATVRAIQNRDVDLQNGVVRYRHTKNRKMQVIPLCSEMVLILREYMRIRSGGEEDYLFCTENGEGLKESGLRIAIARYNERRGIQKTSIHLFRHTFARKYLMDCGGDAFMLQRLLGHSTLQMTKHYCAIFDTDLTRNFDSFSPLSQIKKGNERISMKAARR